MGPSAPIVGRRTVVAQLLTAGAALVALASAFMGLKVGVPRLDDARRFWNELAPALRDDPVADLYGFGEPLWLELEGSVRRGDHYAVVAVGDDQHEIRNYAAYRLLPAIQVRDPSDANVVIYYDVTPPPNCVPVVETVCVLKRQ